MTITDDFKSMTTATDIAASKGEKTHSQDPTNFCTSSLILSQQKLQATHQFMTSTLFFSFQNLKISRELHINQMKVDHSSWNWQWQVARMKAKMDCAFMTLQARLGCAWPFWWVKRWKVRLFPTINSNSDSWLTTPFSFHTAKAVWERVFCCFYCYVRTSTNEVANNSTGMCMIYVFHKRSWVLHCFVDLNVNLHPNLAFNLCYHGDLIQWMFLRMVHANWT